MIVNFQEIINIYNYTIKRVNKKYQKDFYVLKPSDELSKELLNKIKQANIKKVDYNIKELAIPSDLKLKDKLCIEPLIENSELYQKAQEIFNDFMNEL